MEEIKVKWEGGIFQGGRVSPGLTWAGQRRWWAIIRRGGRRRRSAYEHFVGLWVNDGLTRLWRGNSRSRLIATSLTWHPTGRVVQSKSKWRRCLTSKQRQSFVETYDSQGKTSWSKKQTKIASSCLVSVYRDNNCLAAQLSRHKKGSQRPAGLQRCLQAKRWISNEN